MARSGTGLDGDAAVRKQPPLTLALHATSVNGGAADHDIVDDGEAALAAHPIALAILDAAVAQHGGLVEPHAPTVKPLRDRHLVRVEEVPNGPVDDLVWRVAQDVDNGVGRIEDMGVLGEIWT